MKKATLFKKLKDKKIKCTACNHFCTISNNRTGICSVRKNKGGKLYLLVHSKASDTNIDPIEKKPLFHFLPGSEAFSFGTLGCNFACQFCQNWRSSQAPKVIKKELAKSNRQDEFEKKLTSLGHDLPPEEIVNICTQKKIPVIAYTYNEPAIFLEYAYDTAKLAQKEGIKNIFVSNGFESKKAINKIAPYLDAINVDLKAFTKKFYKEICKGRLKPVLDNIKYYHKKGIWLEITTLIIPDHNDSDKELKQIAEFIASVSKDIPWHITRFSPAYKMQNVPQTPEETIKKTYNIGKEAGLKYVYAGNIFDQDRHSTHCPKCKNLLIERDWGYLKIRGLKNGKCEKCGEEIEGVWR